MDESSSDEDSSVEDREVGNASRECLDMVPEMITAEKSMRKVKLKKLRKRLDKCDASSTVVRTSSRLDNKRQLDDHFKDLLADNESVRKKLSYIHDFLSDMFDTVNDLSETCDKQECRINDLERTVKQQTDKIVGITSRPPSTYSGAVTTGISGAPSQSIPSHSDSGRRIDKLEYTASEEERRRRLLQVTITHPEISQNNSNVVSDTKSFLVNKLLLQEREIDPLLQVRLQRRENTVLLTFSAQRYRNFLYAARKRLRVNNPDRCTNLYINENLTNYNFVMMRQLKAERRSRNVAGKNSFHAVYTFDGKVFVRMRAGDSPDSRSHITSPQQLGLFLAKLDSVPITENQQNAAPVTGNQ